MDYRLTPKLLNSLTRNKLNSYSSGLAKEYVFENELQTWRCYSDDPKLSAFRSRRCDGVAKIDFGKDIWIGVEYESSTKSKGRYFDILNSLYKNKAITFIIYVCKNNTILNRIKSIDNERFSEFVPKIFYITLNDLLVSDSIVFLSRDLRSLIFDSNKKAFVK